MNPASCISYSRRDLITILKLKIRLSMISQEFYLYEGDVVNEIALFKLRKDIDEQICQIITRLDNMENDIKTIKDKLNINQGLW